MKRAVTIEHVSFEIKSNFDRFTNQFEKELGILMPAALRSLGAAPASMAGHLNSTGDDSSLMIYSIMSQEDLPQKVHYRNAKQYQLGNPEIMGRMIGNHIGAGLYVPIHLLVYENEQKKVIVEYDLLSSLCAQFNNTTLLADSIYLENNLASLIQKADEARDS
ncbi:hypothetical protein A4H97_31350 [Niastella yeongjuensis]|uniref:DUF302 domain-containing protein n=1 Tax=Niastella yeongjuensis TaxID=354355 RepID=A0A1V9EJE6_9BACT|nr:DUF302 domain-containing protein [Niastella yeongjuensis]OQP46260.1 hypothetical protein A4H97_31350 [Niastella yeongjuensis]SEP46237.1 protein of unknown function DUF302 [Niastella yeongjuensis]